MARRITIDPVTRIEGHARVEVDVDDNGQVTNSVFKVLDFRGWETFLVGTQVEQMPSITARICGTCSASHHLASAKAVDKVLGVTPPRAAELLRYALNLAGYIHSHGVHIFALAGPDLLLGLNADPATRNIMGLIDAAPEVARKALELRAISTRIGEAIGGRGIHPVTAVAGGMAAPLSKDSQIRLKKEADEALTLAEDLFQVVKQTLLSSTELIELLPLTTCYLSLVKDGALDHYQGNLRLKSPEGATFEFSADDWASYLVEETTSSSYAKSVFFRMDGNEGVPYRVGPLARINCCDGIDTPRAMAELEEFRKVAGYPCHQTVLYHYARLIELLYAAEKLVELLGEDEICSGNVKATSEQVLHHGIGVLEAPRGLLIHDYSVDDRGILTDVNLIVATQQNLPSIESTVGMSAKEYLNQPEDLLLNGIEFGIRCYDPCLSCATHRVGEMKLEVVIRKQGEIVRTARRK